MPLWKKRINKGKFCSRDCYAKDKSNKFKGDKNPAYKDGRTKRHQKAFYLSIEWRKLRKEIYKRDKYNCKKCKKHGGELAAHHIIPVGLCKDPLDSLNIITVCRKCHISIHRKNN